MKGLVGLRSRSRRAAAVVALLTASALSVPATATAASADGSRPPTHCRHAQASWAGTCIDVRFGWMKGYDDPATPNFLDRVGVLKVGSEHARNVLVLNPGTSAGAGYFLPLAKDIVARTRGRWQVWSVERRENQLEDQSMLDAFKRGTATARQFVDYYLGYLTDPTVTNHLHPVADTAVPFARGWGLGVEIEDLHRVVGEAHEHGRRVVMGGHSLGGSITTAYATWDFHGKPGSSDLDGLVFIDGSSFRSPPTAQVATQSLQALQTSTPWLAFGGIPSPFLGLFSAVGSTLASLAPNDPAPLQDFALLPANLKPPVRSTNQANFGFAVDTKTSPPNLRAAQVHAGQLAPSGDPRGWVRAGAISPIERYAAMLSGTGLTGVDGSAWYHPMRLTIDAGAVANGNANPAQAVLGVKAVHGDRVHVPMYAFGAALGGQGVLDATLALAHQSHVPDRQLVLVNRQATYAHNDPSAASPTNDFLANLIPFLSGIGNHHDHHGER
jgi:hypothetical protein